MKFGDTLYQRSVPKWAGHNLNYNELKRLIKLRTTSGTPSPVPIPGQTDHRWSLLEEELYAILKEQYDNITLFIRSKSGEIERRLAHLDKSIRSTKRSAMAYSGRPSLLSRKYQKLTHEAEAIGEDIQNLSRYAAVQRTAFRKILKKYRKWTNSEALRERLEAEVFSDKQLDVNVSEQMQHLAAQISTINDLQSSMLNPGRDRSRNLFSEQLESPVTQIAKAAQSGPLQFDAAAASTPFGEAAGTATYWIHSDNIDEARVLLLRYMRDLNFQGVLSRASSSDTLIANNRDPDVSSNTHVAYFDNPYRFVQDSSTHSPSRVALCARWSDTKEAHVTLSNMSPSSDAKSTLNMKRKDLAIALDRHQPAPKDKSASAANVNTVKDFLAQHRDLKALAVQHSNRSRLSGLSNSSEVGTFAVLDTDIVFEPFGPNTILTPGSTSAESRDFPHAVLEIRWEFGRKPEVVRIFDTTHLAERVADFTLESAAIHDQTFNLPKPSWAPLLEKDIRKIPVQARRSRRTDTPLPGTTSGPSSAGDSVFSALLDQSAGSETSPVASTKDESINGANTKPEASGKKKARIVAESPKRSSQTGRYYSEYDDPDSEFYQQEAYTIYVDPDADAPGMATLKKLGSAFSSLWSSRRKDSKTPNERSPLLNDRASHDEETISSDSESDVTPGKPKYRGLQGRTRPAERYRRRLSRRQRAFERTLVHMYSGLMVLSVLFLLLATLLLATGRRKEVVEVDAGATVGLVVAFLCMAVSILLVYMRREKLTIFEKVTLLLADTMISIMGAAVVVGIVQRARHLKK